MDAFQVSKIKNISQPAAASDVDLLNKQVSTNILKHCDIYRISATMSKLILRSIKKYNGKRPRRPTLDV